MGTYMYQVIAAQNQMFSAIPLFVDFITTNSLLLYIPYDTGVCVILINCRLYILISVRITQRLSKNDMCGKLFLTNVDSTDNT